LSRDWRSPWRCWGSPYRPGATGETDVLTALLVRVVAPPQSGPWRRRQDPPRPTSWRSSTRASFVLTIDSLKVLDPAGGAVLQELGGAGLVKCRDSSAPREPPSAGPFGLRLHGLTLPAGPPFANKSPIASKRAANRRARPRIPIMAFRCRRPPASNRRKPSPFAPTAVERPPSSFRRRSRACAGGGQRMLQHDHPAPRRHSGINGVHYSPTLRHRLYPARPAGPPVR